MASIAKHYGEQEGKRDRSVKTGIDFAVVGHTVGVD